MNIRTLTYNIHSAKGIDKKHSFKRIERVIDKIDADIVGLQEVRLKDYEKEKYFLKTKENYYSLFVPSFIKKNGEAYGNALLSKFKIIEYYEVKLLDERIKSHEEIRSAIIAKLYLPDNDHIWVVVSHIAVKRLPRNLQGTYLIKAIKSYVNLAKEKCIVLVDFNEWYSFSYLIRKMNKLFKQVPAKRSFATYLPIFKLDRIWVSKQCKIIKSQLFKTQFSKAASDHYPFFCDFLT
jgi:endonuclease/exonuclease/phosphatase family metal-dependent hydrolase